MEYSCFNVEANAHICCLNRTAARYARECVGNRTSWWVCEFARRYLAELVRHISLVSEKKGIHDSGSVAYQVLFVQKTSFPN